MTIPTVSAPSSRAICATIGAAPVPVPPPAPAAMNTMSEPRSIALIRSCSSRAARRPRSGSEPEPSPRVIPSPMWSVSCAADSCSDCRSVLIARNSTPSISASTIRLTALTPAPPTPTTRSTGPTDRRGRREASAARSERAYTSVGRRGRAARRPRLGRTALEHVLGDVGRERAGAGAPGATGCARLARRSERGRRAARATGAGACRRAGLACGCLGGARRRRRLRLGAASGVPEVSSAVLRNRSASGPSRMLARLPVAI